jgi:hypothetical protein
MMTIYVELKGADYLLFLKYPAFYVYSLISSEYSPIICKYPHIIAYQIFLKAGNHFYGKIIH